MLKDFYLNRISRGIQWVLEDLVAQEDQQNQVYHSLEHQVGLAPLADRVDQEQTPLWDPKQT